jgi:hypothetical protein
VPEQLGIPPTARTNPIPALYPPSGMALQRIGQSGGSTGWSAEAAVETPLPTSELEAFFAAQLADGGWTRLDGGASPSAAWSTWQVNDGSMWQGLLFVAALPGEDQHALSVSAVPWTFESETHP